MVADLIVKGTGVGGALAIAQSGFTQVNIRPPLDTAIYASGDSLHTDILDFADALSASGDGFIETMIVQDEDKQSQPLELWLFSETVTPATANAAHSISDTNLNRCIGVIPSGTYYEEALGSVAVSKGLNLAVKSSSTSLFGILVTRGTPTHTAAGLRISLVISRVG